MNALREKARELLATKTVQVVIGYARGSGGRPRAIFAREAAQARELVFDGTCLQNLAVYLMKPEVRQLGRAALVARPATLRTILQLAAENQLQENSLLVLVPGADGVLSLSTFSALEAHVASQDNDLNAAEKTELEAFAAMGLDERREFWQEQFSRCLKCYACRAACPLCYCTRCTVECNQPQWIPVPAHDLGNLEWNVMRAMHLAGRCTNCGDCSRACPVGIPLYLLNQKLIQDVLASFGARSGMAAEADHSMSTFKPNDSEDFIR